MQSLGFEVSGEPPFHRLDKMSSLGRPMHFASYHVAKFQDAAALALEMGHNRAMLFAHYHEVVEKSNPDNVLVLHDPAVAQQYGREWERLWADSEEMKARYK